MHLAEHVQLQGVCLRCQCAELQIAQGRGDQQNGIGPMGARLQKLEFIHHKVLPQAGQITGLGSHLQIAQTALKKVLFGEHGERSGAPACATLAAKAATSKSGRIKPLRGRRLFQLRDHRRPACRLLPQRTGEAPRLVGGRRLLQNPVGGCGLPLLHSAPGAGQDLCKLAIHHPAVSLEVISICRWVSPASPTASLLAAGIQHMLHMSHFPPLWAKSAEAAGLWQRLRSAPRSLLMLDYDGTLAPFHIDRFAACPYPGVEERLATLSGLARVRLVLVSGRPARELRDLLPPSTKAEIWGSHGREQLEKRRLL